jgi:hypothetical protein
MLKHNNDYKKEKSKQKEIRERIRKTLWDFEVDHSSAYP